MCLVSTSDSSNERSKERFVYMYVGLKRDCGDGIGKRIYNMEKGHTNASKRLSN